MKPQLSQKKAARTRRELEYLFGLLFYDTRDPITPAEWDMIEHTIYMGQMPNEEDCKIYMEMNSGSFLIMPKEAAR